MPDTGFYRHLSILSILTLALFLWEQISWEQINAGEIRPAEPLQMSEPQLPVLVAQKIRQLSSRQLEVRQTAEKGLVELGPEALPFLPSPEILGDASSRDALRRVRQQLEMLRAREAAQPSRITLSGSLTASRLEAEFLKQTSNRVHLLTNSPATTYTINWQGLTFWEAIANLLEVSDLAIDPDSMGSTLTLISSTKSAAERSVIPSGPFAWSVESIEQKPLSGTPGSIARLHIRVRTEPRLDPLFVFVNSQDWQVNALVKTAGEKEPALEKLNLWNPSARYELVAGSVQQGTTFTIDAILPEGKIPGEFQISGKALIHTGLVKQEFDFAANRLKPGQSIRRGGVTITIRAVSAPETKPATIELSTAYDVSGPAFESHRAWVFHRQAWIERGKTGTLEPFVELNVTQAAAGITMAEFTFANPLTESDTFVYSAPLLLSDLEATLKATIPVAR